MSVLSRLRGLAFPFERGVLLEDFLPILVKYYTQGFRTCKDCGKIKAGYADYIPENSCEDENEKYNEPVALKPENNFDVTNRNQ